MQQTQRSEGVARAELRPLPKAMAGLVGPVLIPARSGGGVSSASQEVALRLLRGEPVDALSRELGVEIYRLEEWRRKALLGIETALRERAGCKDDFLPASV